MTVEEWNLWRTKDFITIAREKRNYGTAWFLLISGNPVIVQVRDQDKDRNLHVYQPVKEEEMIA